MTNNEPVNLTSEEETVNAQRIEGRVALVTGANRGIGRALTEALLARGVRKVYGAARNPETLRDLRDERLVPLRLDVTDVDQIREVGDAAPDAELVFNNAGVALAGGIADAMILDQARREMEVNYFGPLQLLHRLAPTLARNGGGAVVTSGQQLAWPTCLLSRLTAPRRPRSIRSPKPLARCSRRKAHPFSASTRDPWDTDMSRALTMPKTSARDVAFAILDAIEAGQEDIFPDPLAVDFGRQFGLSPKSAERQFAAMAVALLAGAAA